MKLVTGEKIVRIRPAFGTVRQVLVKGERYYRETRENHVILENEYDVKAWEDCGPVSRPEFIEV